MYYNKFNKVSNKTLNESMKHLNESESEYRLTAGEQETYELHYAPPSLFIEQFPEGSDIYFLEGYDEEDGKAIVTQRISNLSYLDVDETMYRNKFRNVLNTVKFVWAGYEGEFYRLDDFQILLKSIKKGKRRPKVTPLIVNENKINNSHILKFNEFINESEMLNNEYFYFTGGSKKEVMWNNDDFKDWEQLSRDRRSGKQDAPRKYSGKNVAADFTITKRGFKELLNMRKEVRKQLNNSLQKMKHLDPILESDFYVERNGMTIYKGDHNKGNDEYGISFTDGKNKKTFEISIDSWENEKVKNIKSKLNNLMTIAQDKYAGTKGTKQWREPYTELTPMLMELIDDLIDDVKQNLD